MNNKFKLPKIDILFQMITFVKQMIIPLLFIFINAIRHFPWWGTLGLISGVLLLAACSAYLIWKSFSYTFEQDRMVIYSGVFSKKEKTIYYSRIHSVNISQNIVHRILNLANLSIETPGVAKASADGEVRCLSLDKAKYLQKLLQHMGEASRNDEGDKQNQLLQSIMLNMENTTSREVTELQHEIVNELPTQPTAVTLDANVEYIKTHNQLEEIVQSNEQAKQNEQISLTLDIGLMAKSALTSLNINIVLVWFAGIFAFADDIVNAFFPDSTLISSFFEQFEFNGFSKSLVVFLLIVLISAIMMTWLLSVLFYIIKFFDYRLERKGKQINVSYGLINRQSIVFDQTKVQSIVFDENPLRQAMGYGELKVNIVKSVSTQNQIDNSYIVIHPFIKKDKVQSYLLELMPKCAVEEHEQTEKLPIQSLYTYLLLPLIFSVIPALATVYWLHWNTIWLLLISMIIVAGWRYIQFRTAAISLDKKELKIVIRSFSKYSVYIRRQKIISLDETASPYQNKRQLRKLSLRVLGGLLAKNYAINGIRAEKMEEVKQWLNEYLKAYKK